MMQKHIILLRRAAAVPIHPKPMKEVWEGLWLGWVGISRFDGYHPHH